MRTLLIICDWSWANFPNWSSNRAYLKSQGHAGARNSCDHIMASSALGDEAISGWRVLARYG